MDKKGFHEAARPHINKLNMRKHKIVVKKGHYPLLMVKTADGTEVSMTEVECAAFIGATFGATLQELKMRANDWTLKVKMY